MSIRVGVIGAGIMGSDHARILHGSVSNAVVGGVVDIDLARAVTVTAGIPGARATNDPYELITDPAIEALLIASHDSTHADLVRACVTAGKPVLCEKPLAPTLADCVSLLRDIGEQGAALVSLGFMRRFDPGYVELKNAALGGEIGRPLVLHCVSRGVTAGPGATSESSVTGSSIHDLDIVPWLLDSPITETAWFGARQSSNAQGLQDPQILLLRTADGVLTTVETYLNARYGYDVRCEVVGENGVATLVEPVRVVTDRSLTRSKPYAADWRPRFAEAYRLELQAWVDSLNEGVASPLASAHDGLVANAVADAVISSMHSGGVFVPVRVPLIAG